MIKYCILYFVLFVSLTKATSQCRPPSLFSNSSFENQSCCPSGPGQFNCLDDWQWPHRLASPDYLHTCGYSGILNNPPIYAYPVGYPDGLGAVNILYSSIARSNEMIQTCITQPLDPSQEYSFSSFVGFNKENSQGSLMPLTLALYGSIGTCNTAVSFPGTECPPSPVWELLAEIQFASPENQGWVLRQSDCFRPSRAYNRFVVGTSCSMNANGGALLDLVELQTCTEILQVDLKVEPQTCSIGDRINGAILLDIKNGLAPYTFDWDIDGIGDNDDDQNLRGIPSGSYEVIITDVNGLQNCFNIFVPEDLETPIVPEFDPIEPLCYGSVPPELPTRTINRPRINGTWNPSKINSTLIGINRYVFTPDDSYCSSTIDLDVVIRDTVGLSKSITRQRCSGDGFEIIVNNTRYNEINPSGTEIIPTTSGCDTSVHIRLEFFDVLEDTIRYEGCSGDGFALLINGTSYSETNPNGEETFASILGCDSIVTVDFSFNEGFNFSTQINITQGEDNRIDLTEFIQRIPSEIASIQWTRPDLLSCDTCSEVNYLGSNDQRLRVELTDEYGCLHYITIEVKFTTVVLSQIYIPNSFTPNNDGTNDRFQIFSSSGNDLRIEQFEIYNRYGGLVFKSEALGLDLEDVYWDGTSSSGPVSTGVYVYLIKLINSDGQSILRSGDITLLR